MQPTKPMPPPMPAHELAGLVERAREGDVAAFERLIVSYQPKVYTFAFAFTGSPDVAQDLAQDALVKVYKSLGSFRFQSAFSTWLYSIVKNTYLDAVKSRAGRERALEEPLTERDVAELHEAATAEERLLAKESRRTRDARAAPGAGRLPHGGRARRRAGARVRRDCRRARRAGRDGEVAPQARP